MISRVIRRAQSSAIRVADGINSVPSDRFPIHQVSKEAVKGKLALHGQFIRDCLPKYIQDAQVTFQNELEIMVAPQGIKPVIQFLKENALCRYNNLNDITAVDVPTRINRFEVVYNLLSIKYNARIRVKTYCDELTALDSIFGAGKGSFRVGTF